MFIEVTVLLLECLGSIVHGGCPTERINDSDLPDIQLEQRKFWLLS